MRKGVVLLAVVLVVSVFSSAYADDCNVVRYVDNLDGTMTDCRSNLTWLRNTYCTATIDSIAPDINGKLTWYDAMKWVKGLRSSFCGLTDGSSSGDWRLPTKTEWMSMIISAKKQGFTSPVFTDAAGTGQWSNSALYDFQNIQSSYYWSSTTDADFTSFAWHVNMSVGSVGTSYKGNHYYVWPVRGGQAGLFDTLTLE